MEVKKTISQHPIFETAALRPLTKQETIIYINERIRMGNPLPGSSGSMAVLPVTAPIAIKKVKRNNRSS